MPVDNSTYIARIGLHYDIHIRKQFSLTSLDVIFANFLMISRSNGIAIVLLLQLLSCQLVETTSNISKSKNKINKMKPNHITCTKSFIIISLSCIISLLQCIYLSGDVETNPGPYSHLTPSSVSSESSISNSEIGTYNEVSFIHLNVQSIVPKIDLITAELTSFDILVFTETWLKPSTPICDYEIPGYNPPHTYIRPNRIGGGVSVYIKPEIPSKRRPDLEVPNIECVWLEINMNKKKILLGSFYRPPDSSSDYWNLINHSIDLAFNSKIDNIIVTGDFNCNQISNNHNEIKKISDAFTLFQLISEPTHYTESSSSLIDLILTNNPNLISVSGVSDPFLPNEIRYHCPIFAFLSIPKTKKSSFSRKIWVFNNTNFEQYRNKLSSIDWTPILLEENIDKSAEKITNCILQTATETIPNKYITVRKNDLPWINNSIRKLIRKRKRIHKLAKQTNTTENWSKFRQIRNKCIGLIRTSQVEYFEKLSEKLKHTSNSKEWWKIANSLSGFNTIKTEIPPIKTTDNTIEEIDKNKSELFNNYFASQSTLEDNGVVIPASSPPTHCCIDTIEITDTDVKDVLDNLDVTKSTGPDGLNPRLLKEASCELSLPLSKLFNRSLNESKFPSIWKEANVTPVFKKDDPSLVKNYRPISLLNILGKTMERCIFKHLYNYISSNNLLTPLQSGFRPKDSTILQLLDLTNQFGKALDEGKEIRVIFCDISKAFDRVWHKGLLHKLSNFGIKDSLLNWFSDYLHSRRQRVVINGSNSNWVEISAGVPQGSILGPLLFLVYINDIVSEIQSNIRLFADDTSLYIIIENPNTAALTLNSDLTKIHEWSEQWLVSFNPQKTVSMLLSKKKSIHTHPPLFMNNTQISEVDKHKHLGLIINKTLNWDDHIENIILKASKRLYVLRKLKFRLDRFSLQKLYFSFVRPILEYGDIIWDGTTLQLKQRVEQIHLEAARIITGATKLTNIGKLLDETGWDTLSKRREKHKIITFHKIFHKESPTYLQSLIPPRGNQIHSHNTRGQNNLNTVLCKTQQYNRSFLPSVISSWNNLPEEIRSNPNPLVLKSFLNKDMIKIPSFYNCGTRRNQILHTRLRLGCSSLYDHLFSRNLIPTRYCECGLIETTKHYLLLCKKYTQIRDRTIHTLPYTVSMNLLLFGDPNLSDAENENVFLTVHKFIQETKRFP
ncbi:hypothetical protein FSP39_019583 [Pinctada imbricata]|uniref:Reverse transcriptase domain-containing protein n=1 Tax=Pinctada imbricata TaxID=66713 RepID=A0AA88YP31_PINIB|nr:hypothetical protein FSP39_019583 [Pinctada imbricata]